MHCTKIWVGVLNDLYLSKWSSRLPTFVSFAHLFRIWAKMTSKGVHRHRSVHRHTVHVVIKATLCLLVIVMNLILEAINYYYYYYYSPASPSPPSQSWRTVSISGSSAVLLLFLPMDGSADQRWIFLRKSRNTCCTLLLLLDLMAQTRCCSWT